MERIKRIKNCLFVGALFVVLLGLGHFGKITKYRKNYDWRNCMILKGKGVARIDDFKSNALFDTFEDWEALLKAEKFDLPAIVKDVESKQQDKDQQSNLSKAFHSESDKPEPSSKPSRKASRQQRGPSR